MARAEVGQQGLELGGQVLALILGERGQQGFLVPEEPVHAAFDERVARSGQRHVAQPAVRARPLAADQAFALGPGDALASPSAGHLTGQVIHVNGGAYLGR